MFTRSQNTARLGTRHRITTFGPAQKRLLQASVAVAGPTARGGLHSAPVAGRPTHSIEHDAEAVEQGRPSPERARTSWNKHDGCPLAARVRLHLANHLLQRAHFDLPQPRHGIYVSTPQEASSVSCRLATTGDTPIRQKTALRRLENLVWYCACSDNRCLGTSECSSPQTGHKMPVRPPLTEPCDTVPGAGHLADLGQALGAQRPQPPLRLGQLIRRRRGVRFPRAAVLPLCGRQLHEQSHLKRAERRSSTPCRLSQRYAVMQPAASKPRQGACDAATSQQ